MENIPPPLYTNTTSDADENSISPTKTLQTTHCGILLDIF